MNRARALAIAVVLVLVGAATYGLTHRPTGHDTSAAVQSNPPTVGAIEPIGVDDSTGPRFAQTVLPAVRQALPGAEVSVVTGGVVVDWGGPTSTAQYGVVSDGAPSSLFVEVFWPNTPCAVVGSHDVCRVVHVGGSSAEIRTTRRHGGMPAQIEAALSGVVVRSVGTGTSPPTDITGTTELALARAVKRGLTAPTFSFPAGPGGTAWTALNTATEATQALASIGAIGWPSATPYSNDVRVPARVFFQPPGGGSIRIYVADRTQGQRLPVLPSGARAARVTSSKGQLIYEVWATDGDLDQSQVTELAAALAGPSASS